ncbi:MAG: HisA/HisF family protein [Archaeoglobus sp.]|nr:MAG: HisA/HisF family protein [Archaeoglobus sp.]
MKVYLAMDVKEGRVVWGHEGRRELYESIDRKSLLVNSSHPLEVVRKLKPKRVYLADLDAIEGKGQFNFWQLVPFVDELIIDRGYRNREKAEEDLKENVIPVLGTETYNLKNVFDGVFVSLDFRKRLLGGVDLFNAVEILNSFRLKGVIVLDISRVGTGKINFELISTVIDISSNPVYAGGGIGSMQDLQKLEDMGVKGAILATAVHRKKIPVCVLW